jgi:Preprotein translocase subunit SecB
MALHMLERSAAKVACCVLMGLDDGNIIWLPDHAAVIVTQMVTHGGFVPIYLQPMDFHKMYQDRKKEIVENANNPVPSERLSDRLNAVLETNVS